MNSIGTHVVKVCALLAAIFIGSHCDAGLSPENIAVVVNGKSLRSRTIANHYVHMRNIPQQNVIVLPAVPERLKVDLDDFRERILKPLLETIDNRGLAGQIRLVAYSGDFPTTVDIKEHHERIEEKFQKEHQRPFASITGATYFFRFILADDPSYLRFDSNFYARGTTARDWSNPFGGEQGEQYDAALAQGSGEQSIEGAKELHEFAKKYPTLAPTWVRTAEAYVRAGENQTAIDVLQNAMAAGWCSPKYLGKSKLLSPLLPKLKPEFKRLLAITSQLVETGYQPPVSFSAAKGWTATGYPVTIKQGGIGYMMACSLAVLHDRGSDLGQSIAVLKRASQADYSQPNGHFLFADHADVRSTTRMPGVKFAVKGIESLGLSTGLFKTTLPTANQSVSGMMVGSPFVDFSNRNWNFSPGAIAESLTSLGGAFGNRKQTKLTDYLHAGAAISSGTVAEPYSIQAKFPHPMMYCYYAHGMTAIESYYLSVTSPYQLLIVGDPACQPFANPPPVMLEISQPQNAVEQSGRKITVSARAIPLAQSNHGGVRSIEIYVDGVLQRSVPFARRIHLDLPQHTSGVLPVRSVLVGQGSSEPRVTFQTELNMEGKHPTPIAKVVRGRLAFKSLNDDGSKAKAIEISLKCKGADSIKLFHLDQVVASCKGDQGIVKVNAKRLGAGPLRFRPVAHFINHTVAGFELVDAPGVINPTSDVR